MGWTRHLYDVATVEEAIPFVARQTKNPLRKLQLAFWIRELFVSEEYDRMCKAMLTAYNSLPPQRGGCEAYEYMVANKQSESAVLAFLGYLQTKPTALPSTLCTPPQSTAEVHQVAGIPNEPKRWTEGQRYVLWKAVQDAWRHRNGERLYRLLGSKPSHVIDMYLPSAQLSSFKHDFGLQHRLYEAGLWQSELPPPANTAVWPRTKGDGMLANRLFAIPRQIHARAPPMYPDAIAGIADGCAFWQRVAVVGSDEETEEFYAKYFADDIPDEWSMQEREKSHNGLYLNKN